MKLIDAKKVYQKISWDCPFKGAQPGIDSHFRPLLQIG
jgi:hypothetical protein